MMEIYWGQSSYRTAYGGRRLRSHFLLMILLALGCRAEGALTNSERCGRVTLPIGKILGGDEAGLAEYPWMVSIHKLDCISGSQHVCGGSIINEHWIVTAAHCVKRAKDYWKYEIYAGLHRQSERSRKPSKKYTISKIIVHEDYDKNTHLNDIALLRTLEPIEFRKSGGFLNSICLPDTDQDPTGWAKAAGWGHTHESRNSDVLLAVDVPIVTKDECVGKYYKYGSWLVKNTQFCAGTQTRDACVFDSGGALSQKNEKGAQTLVGIVSIGKKCGDRHLPGLYTKVASYMKWLEKKVSESGTDTEFSPKLFSQYCKQYEQKFPKFKKYP